ncbi:hypothetical protein VNO80_10581 [Phaseolus coccineus]|uniref:Uncharacterized protein n=1 Tax=Phaseolus coccineus TaxID=3886 RepID=A0AAN9RER6_PHACN
MDGPMRMLRNSPPKRKASKGYSVFHNKETVFNTFFVNSISSPGTNRPYITSTSTSKPNYTKKLVVEQEIESSVKSKANIEARAKAKAKVDAKVPTLVEDLAKVHTHKKFNPSP